MTDGQGVPRAHHGVGECFALPFALYLMSRLSVARALMGSGVIGATLASLAGIAGIVGVVSTAPRFCPDSVGAARCAHAQSKAALIGAHGLTAAGVASLLFIAGRAVDPEA